MPAGSTLPALRVAREASLRTRITCVFLVKVDSAIIKIGNKSLTCVAFIFTRLHDALRLF